MIDFIHLFQGSTSLENSDELKADQEESIVMIIIVTLLVLYNLKKGQRQSSSREQSQNKLKDTAAINNKKEVETSQKKYEEVMRNIKASMNIVLLGQAAYNTDMMQVCLHVCRQYINTFY